MPTATPTPATPTEIRVYRGPNFTGQEFIFSTDVRGGTYNFPHLNALGLNDDIESLRIPAGLSVRICQDGGFNGSCTVLTADTPVLGVLFTDNSPPPTYDFTNQISSLQISETP